MYEKGLQSKQQEHISMANEVAISVCDKLNPIEQNEFLEQLYCKVRERRECMIKEAHEILNHLQGSLDALLKKQS